MSGHSKWSTIKRQKGLNDAKRGNVFTKLANAITIAAKLGNSGDPDSNPRLRLALEQARSANMPKDNVQRAVDRGLGKLPGQSLEEIVYEGFGPSKVAYLLEVVTDNKNRTLAEIRNLFERSGGALGSQGSTAYMFDKIGEIRLSSKGGSLEDEELELIDLGAEDVEDYNEDGVNKYLVYVEVVILSDIANKIKEAGFEVESVEIVFKPNIITEINEKGSAEKVIAFTEKLEDNDDIQKVHTNFDIPENLI